ncbi:hypothetical protein NDU88_002748 [Pleurodeles waltl]|uniref:Uncharacterized protein n=1 Tax=Pleurodeles waltl TaxID=8319 RepID=A0AAV7UDY7_PLEWA|nr:hypothetical protein NDU88_002748 [Pleurodeles waltl]
MLPATKCSSELQVYASFQSENQLFENYNSVTDFENVESKILNDEIKRSKDTVILMRPKAPVVKVKEVFTTVDSKKDIERWVWLSHDEDLLKRIGRKLGVRPKAPASCGDLRDNKRKILLCTQQSSNVQPAGYQASEVDRPEERERFGATILTAREKTIAATTSVN